jgi:hypothetical protein
MIPTKRRKMRGTREAERIQSKSRSEAAIQSEASATQSEETDETDEAKEKEKGQRSRMCSVVGLLGSRHSVGSENDTKKGQAKETDKGIREAERIPSKARSEAPFSRKRVRHSRTRPMKRRERRERK